MSTLAIDTIQGATTATSVDMSGVTGLQMPAGYIIQTVHTSTNTQVQTNSGGFVETGLNLSITPKYTTLSICNLHVRTSPFLIMTLPTASK